MAKTKLAKETPQTVSVNIPAEAAMRCFVGYGVKARQAALSLVCAGVAYLLNVNHLRSSDDAHYLAKSKAVEEMRRALNEQADVKHGMLDIYVSRAVTMYENMIGSAKRFTPTIQEIGALGEKEADTAVSILLKWLEDSHKVKSLADLSRLLGYAVGDKPESAESNVTDIAESGPSRVVKAIQSVEKAVKDGKVKESAVVKAAANAVSNPLALARESIKRYAATDTADPAELRSLIETVSELADKLAERIAKADKPTRRAPKAKGAEAQVNAA